MLVAAQPEIFELECAGRLWLQQQQWQTEQPAATASQRGQQEQGQQQPIALVEPGLQAGHFVVALQCAGLVQQPQRREVFIAEACLTVAPAELGCEALQPGVVQPRNQDRAVRILEEAAVLAGNRGTLFGPHAKHQQPLALPLQQRGNGAALVLVQTAADQQQASAAEARLTQQFEPPGNGQVCTLAGLGH